jgi:outer membrane protein assembly factor BamB
MKQPKILLFIIIALLPLTLVSCISGSAQLAKGWSGTTVHEGIIYVGTVDGRVAAVNSSTRNLEWAYSIAPVTTPSSGLSCGQPSVTTAIYGTPLIDRDLVYIGTYSGQVYALTIARGADRWVYPRTGSIGAIVGSPIIANETIYISSSDSMVYALDTIHGDLKWKSEILDEEGKRHEKLWTSPVVHDGAVYVSTLDGHIYALSAETGQLLDWSFEAEAGFASSPVIYEDTIFLGSFDRYLYAVNVTIGSDKPMWKFPEEKPAGNWFWASPIVNEGIVYAGCLDGIVYAIEAETGKELWQFESQDPRGKPAAIVSPPVLAGDLLIVANEAGNVYVIDPKTGDGERIKNPEDDNKSTINAQIRAPFCADEGLAYIRDEDNTLHVVDIENGEVSWNFDLTRKEE